MGATQEVRPAAVAGSFYPDAPDRLWREVMELCATVDAPPPGEPPPKGLLVPHAGYVYSGPIAASAYARLRPFRNLIHRVVLLGPSHRVALRGLALPGTQAFETPLGRIPVDAEATRLLQAFPQVATLPGAHAQEHALEVQLPFLQCLLGPFQLVPLVVGEAPAEVVADVIEALWDGPETLFLVSSDLSHYLPCEEARRVDGRTCEEIGQLRPLRGDNVACGAAPLNGWMLAARRHGLSPRLLDLRNSGDTAGDPHRVVGYASFAFSPGGPLES